MNILAFDLGASGGKIFLTTIQDGNATIQDIHRFDNVAHPINDGLYWDIISIYKEMNIGIKKAIKLTNDNIDSFAIDSYCNDFGIISPNGDLLTPVRCYRDKRTAKNQEKIYSKLSPQELYKLSGNQTALFNTLMQLASIHEEGQSYFFNKGNKLLLIPDLLIYFMTGKIICEYTLASVSQMFDFRNHDWNQTILDAYHIPRELFGDITEPGVVIGQTSDRYNKFMHTKGFSVSIVCEHDTASAYLSSPVKEDAVLVSCGTWALIGRESQDPVITDQSYEYNIANEGSIRGHHRLLKNVMSSWFIQESKKYYKDHGQDYSFEELGDLAAAAEPFQFFIDPDEDAFYIPGDIPVKIQNSCMRRYGKQPESVGAIIRCIYESLGMKFRQIIGQLDEVASTPAKIINMMGGGSKAAMLCQCVSSACNLPVVAGPDEATAIGNVQLQLMAIQAAKTLEDAKELMSTSFTTQKYLPQNAQKWDLEYKKFLLQLGQ